MITNLRMELFEALVPAEEAAQPRVVRGGGGGVEHGVQRGVGQVVVHGGRPGLHPRLHAAAALLPRSGGRGRRHVRCGDEVLVPGTHLHTISLY